MSKHPPRTPKWKRRANVERVNDVDWLEMPMSLAQLLSLVPKGLKPEDVTVDVVNNGEWADDGQHIQLRYTEPETDKEMAARIAKEIYQTSGSASSTRKDKVPMNDHRKAHDQFVEANNRMLDSEPGTELWHYWRRARELARDNLNTVSQADREVHSK
jgi:hypothetical protein